MFGSGSRSPFVPIGTLSHPGVGSYTLSLERRASPLQAGSSSSFNVTSQRSAIVPASLHGGAHAYSSQSSYALPASASPPPPFGSTGPRSDVVPASAWGVPGPGAYTLAPPPRPATSPLTLQRSASPTAPSRTRASPTMPYTPAHSHSPGPGDHSPGQPSPAAPGANLHWGASAAPRMPPLPSNAPGGPGSSGNPTHPADVGAAYKAGAPLSSMVRPLSPAVEALGRGAALALPSRHNPGPGTYLGPWAASGFLAAAAATPEGQAQYLGSRASREFVVGAPQQPGPESPSPASYSPLYGGQGSGSGSGSGGGFLGGTEPRFRLPPDEKAARETPGPGAYSLRRPATVAGGSGGRSSSSYARLRALSRGSGAGGTAAGKEGRGSSRGGGQQHSQAVAAAAAEAAALLAGLAVGSDSHQQQQQQPPIPLAQLQRLYTAPHSSPGSARAATARARSREAARSRSPGPVYDTRGQLAGGGCNAAAGRGELMGRGSGRELGGPLPGQAALLAGSGLGPGSYELRWQYPGGRGSPVNAALGPPAERLFGTGGRSEMGVRAGQGGGEYVLPLRPWACEGSFNQRERDSLARISAHAGLRAALPR